jgi:hypothetical protein
MKTKEIIFDIREVGEAQRQELAVARKELTADGSL